MDPLPNQLNGFTLCACSAGKKEKARYRYENVVAPKAVDWRTKDIVGPIKNQHVGGSPCGCCWAFATIGVTECIVAMATGKPISLSEQQLIDCDKAGARSFGTILSFLCVSMFFRI